MKKKGKGGEDKSEEKKEEEEEEEIVVEPTVVEIPSLPRLKDASEVRFSRLPNLLHLAPCAFDGDTYSEDREMKQLKKLGKELVGDNIIRWRVKRDAIHQPVMDEKSGKPVIGAGFCFGLCECFGFWLLERESDDEVFNKRLLHINLWIVKLVLRRE